MLNDYSSFLLLYNKLLQTVATKRHLLLHRSVGPKSRHRIAESSAWGHTRQKSRCQLTAFSSRDESALSNQFKFLAEYNSLWL